MIVKPAPRLATILCRWFGRLAMPIGEALSAAAGAMSGRSTVLGGGVVAKERCRRASRRAMGYSAVGRDSVGRDGDGGGLSNVCSTSFKSGEPRRGTTWRRCLWLLLSVAGPNFLPSGPLPSLHLVGQCDRDMGQARIPFFLSAANPRLPFLPLLP